MASDSKQLETLVGESAEETRFEGYSPRYALLDHWRAIASVMVVIFHATAQWRTAAEGATGLTGSVTGAFWLGVQLFFVISGYCIAAAAISAYDRSSSPGRHYLVRRLRRIFPPYLAWLALLSAAIAIMEVAAPQFLGRDDFRISQLSLINWIGNITLSETWLPRWLGAPDLVITRVGWTLCFEVQFYLVCLAIMLLFPKRYFFLGTALVSALLLVLFLWDKQLGIRGSVRGTFLDGRWLQFALGIWVYAVLTKGQRWQMHTSAVCMLLIGILSFQQLDSYSFGESIILWDKKFLELSVCAVFAALLIWSRPLADKNLDSPFVKGIQNLGIASYSLYLVHWPICKVLGLVAWKFGLQSGTATMLITVPICVAISIAVAAIFFRLFEKPFIQPKSRPTEK